MVDDLKIIKKKYGEGMMHLCRNLFPIILETNGLLSNLLLDHFNDDRQLYEDIVNNQLETEFKNYIYSVFDKKNEEIKDTDKSPKELLDNAGYNFYECKSEKDIQNFKKYYAENEELCTFLGGRLNRCHVFFAVKKNVDKIKRKDFENPQRQDLYGTSVISIQFTKDINNTLSIKNRYNHRVANPDATFSNDLDRIIPGLTDSFEKHYGIYQKCKSSSFEIPGYVKASDNKYYKYNVEICNVYYCTNNVIIDNFKLKKYPSNQYLIMDYFILDFMNKTISTYDKEINDSFINMIGKIDKINVEKSKDYKTITIKSNNGITTIKLNKSNQIIGVSNNIVTQIEDNFLYYKNKLKNIRFKKLKKIGARFLNLNVILESVDLPELEYVGSNFLMSNEKLEEIYLPNLLIAYSNFLRYNENLKKIRAPRLKKIGSGFLYNNKSMVELELPSAIIIENDFMKNNSTLKTISLQSVKTIKQNFLYLASKINDAYLPNLESYESSSFFSKNNTWIKKKILVK